MNVLTIILSLTAISVLFRTLFSRLPLQDILISEVSNETIAIFLKEITREPHVAGTPEDFATADYVYNKFTEFGLSARFADYDVLLSYPLNRSLSLLYPNGSSLELRLQEEAVEGDNYSNNSKIIPTFLAYSPSGHAHAEVVYANYGQKSDFDKLKELKVDVNGTIVIARLGKSFRGDIVFNAEREGAVGVVLYTDPQEYAANGTEGFYPTSRWLPPSGVQRGSLFLRTGDPLTPGWPSTPDAERLDASNELPRIPALPISAEDALPILQALEGPVAPVDWQGGLVLNSYRIGRGPAKLDLHYLADNKVTRIRNVIGVLEGVDERDRYVLFGNHRDAWTFGASDPNSGTACLLEVARILGKYLRKPSRTIVFCSWDAEEYGLTGSTEWVEENLDLLSAQAVAYMNVDRAIGGEGYYAYGTPQLDDLIHEITKMVKDPDFNGTIYDSWCKNAEESQECVGRLGGGGSDYAPFLQHAGVPSTNMAYGASYPVYHSTYDNYNWVEKFGDPLFQHHVTVAAISLLLAYRLATDNILPFNYVTYANSLEAAVKALEQNLLDLPTNMDVLLLSKSQEVTFAPLYSALNRLRTSAAALQPTAPVWQKRHEEQRRTNDRLLLAERSFLDSQGLPGNPWYRHLVYGPTDSNVYGTETFPAIVDALAQLHSAAASGKLQDEQHQSALVKKLQHEIWRAARVVVRAANVLKGELS